MVTVEQQATALAAKAQPAPTAVSSTPARAGPISPPSWNVVEFTLMALRRYLGPHELVDEHLPGRLVQHGHEAQYQGDHVDVPDLDRAGSAPGRRQHCGQDGRRGLAHDEDLALGKTVRNHAAPRAKE
jgi:hypothetical protein